MYNTLKGLIDQYIIENTQGEITGDILNNVLNQMVSILGSGSKFKGSIHPDSEAPSGTEGENDYFYIATSVGTYTNFGNVTVSEGELAFVKKEDSSWVKYSWDISSLLSGKQDTISDLATIRSGASAGASAYQKPQNGIPKTDLSSDVQASLNKAETAIQEHQDISGKADKVNNAANGNFAGLDANGNLTDSGKKASDFATDAQGAKADTAYQKPQAGIPESDLSADVQQALQKHFKGWYDDTTALNAKYPSPVVGDYAYVEEDGTTYIYRCTTDGEWPNTSTEEKDPVDVTFADGEEVIETHIDKTNLVNPVSGALPTAADVMQLKAKLDGVTASEVKVVLEDSGIHQNIFNGAVNGDGTMTSSTSGSYKYLQIEIPNGVNSIRFLSKTKADNSITGYQIGHFNSIDEWVCDESWYYPNGSQPYIGIDETIYLSQYPNATHFRTNCKLGNITLDNFYCYLRTGSPAADKEYVDNAVLSLETEILKPTILHLEAVGISDSVKKSIKLQEGSVYRVTLPQTWWDAAEISNLNYYFFFNRYVNGERVDLDGIYYADKEYFPHSFDIFAKENDEYQFGIRGVIGEEVDIKIEKIDPCRGDINISENFHTADSYINSAGKVGNYSGTNRFTYPLPTFGKKYLKFSAMVFQDTATASVPINRGVAFYDEDMMLVKYVSSADVFISTQQRGGFVCKVKIPEKARYLNMCYWYGDFLANHPEINVRRLTAILTDDGFGDVPILDGNFDKFIGFLPYDGLTDETLLSLQYNDLIGLWESLRSGYSDQITMSVIGYATAAGSQDATPTSDTNLPIYEYVVKPLPKKSLGYEEYLTTTPNNVVKILIITGVHGAEKTASMSVLELVKNLVGHYQDSRLDDGVISIAQNCEFHIIPCVNPFGYNNYDDSDKGNGRLNARGVNINRNFGYNWTYQPGSSGEKGISEYSELETQVVKSWLDTNKDALLFIDAHSTLLSVNSNPDSAYQGCFSYTGNLFDKLVYNSFLKQVSVFAQNEWPDIFSRNQYIGFCGYSVTATSVKDALFNVGIPHSYTLEVNDNAGNLGRGNRQQIVLSTNQIFNIIRSVICNCRY